LSFSLFAPRICAAIKWSARLRMLTGSPREDGETTRSRAPTVPHGNSGDAEDVSPSAAANGSSKQHVDGPVATASEPAAAMLRDVPFFSRFPEHHLVELSSLLDRRELPAGHEIVRQGDVGDSFFLIASGSARVYVQHGSTPPADGGPEPW
jgi:hypothetical protein